MQGPISKIFNYHSKSTRNFGLQHPIMDVKSDFRNRAFLFFFFNRFGNTYSLSSCWFHIKCFRSVAVPLLLKEWAQDPILNFIFLLKRHSQAVRHCIFIINFSNLLIFVLYSVSEISSCHFFFFIHAPEISSRYSSRQLCFHVRLCVRPLHPAMTTISCENLVLILVTIACYISNFLAKTERLSFPSFCFSRAVRWTQFSMHCDLVLRLKQPEARYFLKHSSTYFNNICP